MTHCHKCIWCMHVEQIKLWEHTKTTLFMNQRGPAFIRLYKQTQFNSIIWQQLQTWIYATKQILIYIKESKFIELPSTLTICADVPWHITIVNGKCIFWNKIYPLYPNVNIEYIQKTILHFLPSKLLGDMYFIVYHFEHLQAIRHAQQRVRYIFMGLKFPLSSTFEL